MISQKKPEKDASSGIALLQVIIVLILIGSLIGIGAILIGPFVKRIKYNETNDIIDAAVKSLISYAASNNRLPDSATFQTVVRNPNDVWTKPLVYIYDNDLTNIATGGVCGRRTTGILQGTTYVAFVVLSGGDDYSIQSIPGASGAYTGNLTLSDQDVFKVVSLNELQ